ncbi:MAG TPA: ornithine cyclodeaminase family protein [Actinomycetota bacterium]|nr:ornithine cyclodeaminase family protein [Actinomycetota bacterium]
MSSELRVIGAEELRARLPMTAAIDALERGFRTGDPSSGPLRTRVETRGGSLLLMPASDASALGVKLVSLTPDNPARGLPLIHAVYVLFDADAQAPRAILDGGALTALRTAAVSGLATRHLAGAGATRLVVFGAGVQARAHVEAMRAVRPIEELVVVSRTAGPAEALAAAAAREGVRAAVGGPEVVADADVVCTCTTAEDPVFDGSLLREGAHVNAVGAHTPATRELDTETVRQARVVVETREAALAEAGDLVIPVGEGAIDSTHVVADLAELVGGTEVRRSADDVTVYKGVGIAFEDLVVAGAIVDAA